MIFFVGAVVSLGSSTTSSVGGSVLRLTLSESITDKAISNPVSLTSIASMDFDKKYLTTMDVLNAIAKAKDDSDIKGIYLDLSDPISVGMAQMDEIRIAIAQFKLSGKFVVSYANTYDQKPYLLASIADKIYLNPEGMVWWQGMQSEVMFFKGTLDKLGIKSQIVRHGKYKSAVEPFTSETMSQENRQQITALLGSVWGCVVGEVAHSRQIDSLKLQNLATDLALPLAQDALDNSFVDGLIYRDQMEDILSELTGEKKPKMVSLSDYIDTGVGLYAGSEVSKNKIAVIYAEGDIVDGKGDATTIGGDRLAAQIAKVRKDSTVKAMVLRVNSPGGSSLASEIIWREMSLTQQKKPVIVSLGNTAASGGYYISAPGDAILASPFTVTGSIGVFALGMDASKGAKEKLGINVESVKTNANSGVGSIFSPMTPAQHSYMVKSIEQVYKTFTTHVADGRNLSLERVDELGGGRVWSGIEALDNGLIDGYGTLRDAVVLAADKAGIATDFRMARYSDDDGLFAQLLNSLSSSRVSGLDSELMELAARLKSISESSRIQVLLPYDIEFK